MLAPSVFVSVAVPIPPVVPRPGIVLIFECPFSRALVEGYRRARAVRMAATSSPVVVIDRIRIMVSFPSGEAVRSVMCAAGGDATGCRATRPLGSGYRRRGFRPRRLPRLRWPVTACTASVTAVTSCTTAVGNSTTCAPMLSASFGDRDRCFRPGVDSGRPAEGGQSRLERSSIP